MKVSFDFDSTLSMEVVQALAVHLISDGHEVWIVTSRHEFADKSGNKVSNNDLFEVSDELGIPREHIHFCNMADKYEFLEGKDFLWHLDDDAVELQFLRIHTNVFPIHRRTGNDWLNQCLDLLRIIPNLSITI